MLLFNHGEILTVGLFLILSGAAVFKVLLEILTLSFKELSQLYGTNDFIASENFASAFVGITFELNIPF